MVVIVIIVTIIITIIIKQEKKLKALNRRTQSKRGVKNIYPIVLLINSV